MLPFCNLFMVYLMKFSTTQIVLCEVIGELINNGFRGCRREQQPNSLRYNFCFHLENWKNQEKPQSGQCLLIDLHATSEVKAILGPQILEQQ